MFHALTDGLGAVNFLKSLTERYLDLMKGRTEKEEDVDGGGCTDPGFHMRDGYLENYRDVKTRHYSSRPAYRLEGDYLPLGTAQVLHGCIKVKDLKALCHKHGVSITKYLASALIWSIWQEYLEGRESARPVVLNVPINLRAFFGSDTMANFFAVTMIGQLFKNRDMDFETLLGKISRQMERKINKETLEESICYNVSNEKKWYLRAIPLFLKRPVLEMFFRIKDRAYTMTLSNIGLLSVSPEYGSEIERFHLVIGVSRRQPLKCGVCAYGEELVVTFASVFADSRLQKRFFGKLREDGISVHFEGNELSGVRKRDMYPRIRKVLILRKGGEEKAARMAKQVGTRSESAARGIFEYASGKRSWKEELMRRLHI